MDRRTLGRIEGVIISDLTFSRTPSKEFYQLTEEAMALIRVADPRRYRRVCRYLRYVVNSNLVSAGIYDRNLKSCSVDFEQHFRSKDHLQNVQSYACLLVHEATHALLFDRNIPYNRDTREQIERLCSEEEVRLTRRLGNGEDILRPRYNAEFLEWYWQGGKSVKNAQLKRLREAFTSQKSAKTLETGKSLPATNEGRSKNAQDYNDLGLSYRQRGDNNRAISYYNHAILLDPTFALAYNNRGFACLCEEMYDRAISDCSRAIELNPNLALAYCNRGRTYRKLGKYEQAFSDYDKAIALAPRFAIAYFNRGIAYQWTGNYERALADYRRAVELEPSSPGYCDTLALLLATCPQGRFRNGKEAVEMARKACELWEWKKPSGYKTLAAASAEAGDFESAVKWQKQFISESNLDEQGLAKANHELARYSSGEPLTSGQSTAAAPSASWQGRIPITQWQSLLDKMVGKPCWSMVGVSGGSMFTLDFGAKVERKMILKNETLRPEQQRFIGEYTLFVRMTGWTLHRNKERICDCNDSNANDGPMVLGLLQLEGKELLRYRSGKSPAELMLYFSEGYRLVLNDWEGVDQEDEAYVLFGDAQSIAVRMDGELTVSPSAGR